MIPTILIYEFSASIKLLSVFCKLSQTDVVLPCSGVSQQQWGLQALSSLRQEANFKELSILSPPCLKVTLPSIMAQQIPTVILQGPWVLLNTQEEGRPKDSLWKDLMPWFPLAPQPKPVQHNDTVGWLKYEHGLLWWPSVRSVLPYMGNEWKIPNWCQARAPAFTPKV